MAEGSVFFSTDRIYQFINSLLTGYKTFVSCDRTSMSRDKNVELLNDLTCRTT